MTASNDEMARDKLESAKGHVIEAIAETMDVYGVTPAAGKLYATMYFKDQMNLDEMREELDMSKPSMSTSVRKLQEIEMVKKNSSVDHENIRMLRRRTFPFIYVLLLSDVGP